MLGRFHRGRALTGLSRSRCGAVIRLGALQRLTLMLLRFVMLLGGSILDGTGCIVTRLLRLTARGNRTRACNTRRPGTGILSAG